MDDVDKMTIVAWVHCFIGEKESLSEFIFTLQASVMRCVSVHVKKRCFRRSDLKNAHTSRDKSSREATHCELDRE